ncbi:MAG: 2-phospho-L-lactate transferase [Halorhabdus sp.]
MVTFLAGGTGTPKLLVGADPVFPSAETTVVANTGDDIEMGGLLVCPDVDTCLFQAGDVLDTDTWWGIDGDTAETHEFVQTLTRRAGYDVGPRYLSEDRQTEGRTIARWRRFSAVGEFMHIGDRDRAVHVLRTSLLDQGYSLTAVTDALGDALGADRKILPMSDDPVASIIHTPRGAMHFQEFWVAHDGDPVVDSVEFRGAADATATDAVRDALTEPVVIGPSNPVTSVGPMTAIEDIAEALRETPVVAVSPFVDDRVYSGPASKLMEAQGYDPSTAGVADAYPFADAFILDETDDTDLDRPTIRTDTTLETEADATRVARAAREALEVVR